MHLIQITPGAGRMYCGNCLRDNALVAAWRRLGHDVLMVPLYLPLTLDEPDAASGTPIFFSGLNVYLDQKLPLFRAASAGVRRWLSNQTLLRWIGRFAARTRPEQVADLALSMLRGEHGNQARDLDELIAWLESSTRPDVICLSNALLLGMARTLKTKIKCRIVCFLAGEEAYIEAMPNPLRARVWETLTERARDIDLFIAQSRYFATRMSDRMALPSANVMVIPPGLELTGYAGRLSENESSGHRSPAMGYFARMCPQKGLDMLVDAYIIMRESGRAADLRLKIGGGCGPADAKFVAGLKRRLRARGLLSAVEFHPNLGRNEKIAFLESLKVFSVPARGDSFGLYLLEAMAAGVPIVEPPTGAYPEVIETTGGGLLSDADTAQSLAKAVLSLLEAPELCRQLSNRARVSMRERYDINIIAQRHIEAFSILVSAKQRLD